MDNNNKADLLAGYFQGTLTQHEQEEVEEWINASEENRMLAGKACKLEQYVSQYSFSLRPTQLDPKGEECGERPSKLSVTPLWPL